MKKLKFRVNKKDKFKVVDLSTIDYIATHYIKRDITQLWTYAVQKESKKPIRMDILYNRDNIRLLKHTIKGKENSASSGNVSIGLSMGATKYFGQRKDENHAAMLRSGTVIGKSFEKIAKAYFKDCKALIQKLGTKGFKKGDIEKVVEYYDTQCFNQCVQPPVWSFNHKPISQTQTIG